MARLVTSIDEDKKLCRLFLERYVIPRRQIQRGIIEEAIASGELKRATDPELLSDTREHILMVLDYRYDRSFRGAAS